MEAPSERQSNLCESFKIDQERWRRRRHLRLLRLGPTSSISMLTQSSKQDTVWVRLWSCKRKRSLIVDQTSVLEEKRNSRRGTILWLLEEWESRWWEISSTHSCHKLQEIDLTLLLTEEIRLKNKVIPLVSNWNQHSIRSWRPLVRVNRWLSSTKSMASRSTQPSLTELLIWSFKSQEVNWLMKGSSHPHISVSRLGLILLGGQCKEETKTSTFFESISRNSSRTFLFLQLVTSLWKLNKPRRELSQTDRTSSRASWTRCSSQRN